MANTTNAVLAVTASDVSKVVGGAGLMLLPFASNWNKLDWHFKLGRQSQAMLFNALAGTLATILYTAYMLQAPPRWLITQSPIISCVVAGATVVGYVSLYYGYKRKVADDQVKWPIYVALPLYIAAWCVVAVFARQAFIFKDYQVFGGYVFLDGKPYAEKVVSIKQTDEVKAEPNTDGDGYFVFFRRVDDTNFKPDLSPMELHVAPEDEMVVSDSIRKLEPRGQLDAEYRFRRDVAATETSGNP